MSLPVPYQGHLGPLIWRGRRDPEDPGRGLPPHCSHASVLCGWKYHQRPQLSHVSITSAIDSFLWRIQPLFFSRICVLIVQLLSRVQLFATLWTAACQASLSFTISRSLLKIVSIDSVIPSNHVILYRPLLPSTFPSIRIFSNESALHIRWPKYWSFSFSISPSNGYSGSFSFWIDWFDLLAVQEALKSLLQLQFESVNSSVLSLLYGPTLEFIRDYWKNHSFD